MSEKNAINDLPCVKAVAAAKAPWTLKVTWKDGSQDVVDLTGLVNRSRHFRRFLAEPKAFRDVAPADYGGGVAWSNGLDYAATTLKMLAEEQRSMSGKELAAFEAANNFSTAETAILLGVAERTVRDYRKVKKLPPTIALALRAMKTNSAILDAHYRPVERRPRGRPRNDAAPK